MAATSGKSDAAAAIQKQLLAFAQAQGNAEKALHLLIQSGAAGELSSPSSALEKATALLRRGVNRADMSPPSRANGSTAKSRDAKSAKESDKQWALVAAKVAQSVIKLYIGGGGMNDGAPPSAGDLACALDLATLALSITCQFESLVKLGEFVIENMLYQIAKKLSELPNCSARALWIFAAIHLRVWHQHASTCTALNQKTLDGEKSPFTERIDELLTKRKNPSLELDDLVALCSFPAPQSFHTLQFTRFLVSLVNAAVNMLLAVEMHKAILEVSRRLEPWILHLSRIPGVDSKLSASFSDRMFRVLWKCAASVDAQKPEQAKTEQDQSLAYRSLALSFMLKCPNYSNGYFIQQIHRVGVQYEKKTNPATDTHAGAILNTFYTEGANALFEQRIQHGIGSKPSSVDWDFVSWLEHFASICDFQPPADRCKRSVDTLTALHQAINHLSTTESANRIVKGCFQLVAASVVVEHRVSSESLSATTTEKEIRGIFASDVFHSTIAPMDQEKIVTALVVCNRKRGDGRWLESFKSYAEGVVLSCSVARDAVSVLSDAHLGLVLRLVRRASTRLFTALNTAVETIGPAADLIISCMVSSADLLSILREGTCIGLSRSMEDSVLSLEGRIRRYSVSLNAKRSTNASTDDPSTHLAAISKQTVLFQKVVDHAMSDTGKQRASMPSLLNDLQAIAREAYMCATFFYKNQQHELVELSLSASFGLAENYLEQVLCNDQIAKNPSQVEAAHVSLKVDAVASLLAFSCRQQGKISQSRKYHGHAILYSSAPKAVAKTGAVDKYVNAVVEEYEALSSCKQGHLVVDALSSLCESVASAWSVRGVDNGCVTSMIRLLADSFECCSSRLVDQLRLQADDSRGTKTNETAPQQKISFCTNAEMCMWKMVWTRARYGPEQLVLALEDVVRAIGNRKAAFCEYYVNRHAQVPLSQLHEAHDDLTKAIKVLSTLNDPTIDAGACYGWRGVLTLEICQMSGYSDRNQGSLPLQGSSITEETALEDIRHCLACWREAAVAVSQRTCEHVFDSRGIALCLDAISHALSLMSHVQLESEARALLSSIQASSPDSSALSDVGIGLSSTILQPMHIANDISVSLSAANLKTPSSPDSGLLRLGVIDADIGLCIATAMGGDVEQARVHLSNASTGIQALRSTIKITSEDAHLYSAMAMRELALSMAESEVVFHEGNITQSISDAKTALSICWRISKKVGVVEKDRERHLLPEEVTAALGKYADHTQKASQLIFFQAIECWSWDILLAAKIILSRIAHLYALSNQPFRSSLYHAEAMTLVSGIVPSVTRNQPFFEFAQLQVLAERTSHATAVHQLVTLSSESDVVFNDDDAPANANVVIQNCEVQLQRGDLYLLEGKEGQAMECYENALQLLGRVGVRIPAVTGLSCGCYRRVLKLQLGMASTPWSEDTVDRLLDTLKNLKRAIKKCVDLLEYALSSCRLVQASLTLLRSSSSKAFLPLDKLVVLIQAVLLRCGHLSVAFLSQEIRFTLGLVYLMLSESRLPVLGQSMSVSVNWAAAAYLSSYHVHERVVVTEHASVLATASPVDSFVSRLGSRIRECLPRTWLLVSITLSELSDFTISITPTNGCEPVSFWIGRIKWAEHAQELDDIIEASRITLFGNTENGDEEWTPEKKKQWWSTRNELDVRLRDLIIRIQGAFGFWRALLTFLPQHCRSDSSTTLLSEISARIHHDSRPLTQRSSWLVSAVAAAKNRLTDAEILQCIDHLAIEENVSIRLEMAQELMKLIRSSGGSDLSNLASSTILILHQRLEKFPWEGLDILQDHSVTRMPSIELILDNATRPATDVAKQLQLDVTAYAHRTSVSYLLNPAGDLKSTQTNLEPLFRRAEVEYAWRGVIGEVPEEDWMRESLLNSSLFVFCGHGSGEKYFHRDKIAALRGQGCAAALLFGCSSGRLEREGVFGPNGAVVSYLQAGSPAVLAMLWDVTDKDVDLMSKDILENWLLADPSEPPVQGELLSVALQRARRLCKLQHLNGLAAVCYGLPLGISTDSLSPIDSSETKRRKLR